MSDKYSAKIAFYLQGTSSLSGEICGALSCALLARIPHILNSLSEKVSKCIGNILKSYFATPFGTFR
jgi:hypothetical protein